MSTFRDWEAYKRLKNRADTNSVVDVLKNKSTGDLIVRKIIYGIEQPLYQAVFTREMRALYKLNKCSNIVNILGDDYLVISTTKEKVGVIYLEYINGIELGKSSIENFSAKERFSIIKQLLDAIEISHSNGIIHRDINPNNIMLTDDKQVKLIDFGICKINDMINSATVYKLGTNAYSAPEVHQHSENATEKSDLYSLGAVIYFLFTGQQPPLAVQFQDVLNRTSGMDVSLKPILKKLVAENPDDRYENVYELRADFSKLFTRFLNLDKTIILTAAYERIKELRNLKLLPQSINIKMATETYMPENFLDLYAFCRKEESNENEETMIYIFLGFNFQAECVFDDEQSVFDVVKFRKIPPIDRDRLKKRFAKIEGEIRFADKRIAHRELKNDSFEIKNIIYDYYENYMSNNNVDCEYKEKYGVWRDLLELIREDIEKNVVRLPYDSYEVKNNLLRFKLKKGTFIDEERLNKEQVFVYEKKVGKKKDKIKPVTVGTYENDIYEKNHVVLEINKQGTIGLPASGFIQYRMHPTIGTLISHVFYNDEIQNGVEAQDRELCIEGYEGIAIEWISTSKYSTKERYEKEFDNNGKKSYQNYLERNIIERKLLELDSKLVKRTKVAVITGYGSQKYILQTMVKQHSFKHIEVDVDTVDAFQGSQKDIILYSTVRSSGNKYGIGFLKSEARINVAFSRARCLLIIVGDMKFLDNYKIRGNKFPEIIKYITESEGCRIIEK